MSEYRDSFSDTGWTRLAKALSASFPIGRFFRVQVRVFWLTLLVMPLVLIRTTEHMSALEAVSWIAAVVVLLYVTIWTHEMSHILAARRYRIHTPLITLSPLGGLAHLSQPAPDARADIIISGAGPLVHVLWLALLWPLSHLLPLPTGASWTYELIYALVDAFVVLNLFLFLFNLLPVYPLDGGRIFRAFLSMRMHPNRATLLACRVGIIGAVVFIVVGIVLYITVDDLWGLILVVIGISGIGACRAEQRAAQYAAGPYQSGEALAPWQSDPEAWKAGGSEDAWKEADAEAPSGRTQRKQEREAARQAAEDAALDAELDRILARINEVGMAGLTKAEKAVLERAARRRRET